MSTAREKLEQHLDALAVGDGDIDELYSALVRLGEITEDEYAALPRDGSGRITVATADDIYEAGKDGSHARPYFNIRDRAAGNPEAARNLAEWALRRYAAAMHEINEINEAAAWRQQQVESWRAKAATSAARSAEFFEGVLDQYMDDFADGERRITLPGGALKLTKCRETIEWDEPAALAWAVAQPEADEFAPRKLSRSAVKSALGKVTTDGAVTADGEPVSFVRMVPPAQADKFTVELS